MRPLRPVDDQIFPQPISLDSGSAMIAYSEWFPGCQFRLSLNLAATLAPNAPPRAPEPCFMDIPSSPEARTIADSARQTSDFRRAWGVNGP